MFFYKKLRIWASTESFLKSSHQILSSAQSFLRVSKRLQNYLHVPYLCRPGHSKQCFLKPYQCLDINQQSNTLMSNMTQEASVDRINM